MLTYEEYVEERIRPYAEGLHGDATAVQAALAQLDHDLGRDLLASDLHVAALQRAGVIAAARDDLPLHERLALVEGVLRLHLQWINHPLCNRAVAYPLLDAIARDEGLPVALCRDAQDMLDAEARRCVTFLVQHASESKPWADDGGVSARPEEAEVDALFDRLGRLSTVHYALALIDLPALAHKWRPTLMRAATLAAEELAHHLETDADFALQPQPNYLAAVLATHSWLPQETQAALQRAFDRYAAELLEVTDLQPEAMTEDHYWAIVGMERWPALQPEARARVAAVRERYAARFASDGDSPEA